MQDRNAARRAVEMAKLRNWTHASVGRGPEAADYLLPMVKKHGPMAPPDPDTGRIVYISEDVSQGGGVTSTSGPKAESSG